MVLFFLSFYLIEIILHNKIIHMTFAVKGDIVVTNGVTELVGSDKINVSFQII